MDWTIFYGATAGAAATLIGLLFIAIQLHIDTLSSDPNYSRWRALARSTFDHYVALFFVSLLMLIPSGNFALFVMIVALPGIVRLLRNWIPVWRRMFRDRRERIVEVIWLVASPLAVYLAMAFFALRMLRSDPSPEPQRDLAYCVVGLFANVLRNSWKLMIEIASDRRAV